MWILSKSFKFEASHQLPNHDGKCRRLHGHSWRGRLICEGVELQSEGAKASMLIDYGDISAAVEPLVFKYLDHYHLNESTKLENPTSEELSRWVFDKIKPILPSLAAVIIEETCTTRCEYRP